MGLEDIFQPLYPKLTTRIILVRHGQTEWNRVERFRGRFDIPLNQTGRDQAKKTAEHILSCWNPSVIISSPLNRAKETANTIADTFHLAAQLHQGLIDIDYGKWQGLTPDEAKKTWPKEVENWFEHPEKAEIPEGENLKDIRSRISQTFTEIGSKHENMEIVLVSHTVINRLLLMHVLNIDDSLFWRLHQDPCAINVIEINGGSLELVSMNDTCHLD